MRVLTQFERIRDSAAIQIGSSAAYAGSPSHELNDSAILIAVRDAWREVGDAVKAELLESDITKTIGSMIGKIRILFVGASPRGEDQLRVSEEHRAIEEAIKLSSGRDMLETTVLSAPTIDDLRRALLGSTFEVIHFSGHGDGSSFLLHGDDGSAAEVSLDELCRLVERHDSVRCVIFNSCNSAAQLSISVGPLTVAMDDEILRFACHQRACVEG